MMEVAALLEVPPCLRSDPRDEYPQFTSLIGEHPLLISKTVDGSAMVTNFRFCVIEKKSINIPLMMVGDLLVSEAAKRLRIGCKDGSTYSCTFVTTEDCQSCTSILRERTGLPQSSSSLFAYRFYALAMHKQGLRTNLTSSEEENILLCQPVNPAFAYNFDKETERLQFDTSKQGSWRKSQANKSYEFCPTYPKFHILPAAVDDDRLKVSLDFRALKRFPSVVWRDKRTGMVLIRSSQPLSSFLGVSYFTNHADVSLIEEIVNACNRDWLAIVKEGHKSRHSLLGADANKGCDCAGGEGVSCVGDCLKEDVAQESCDSSPVSRGHSTINGGFDSGDGYIAKKLAIVDCRSLAGVWGNSFKGGGTEDEAIYKCNTVHLDLANIHNVRDSFNKLRILCHAYVEGTFLKSLSSCMWLSYISALLRGANIVVELMHVMKRPVLVHCSDGWDRTSQIVSLSELMMDSYYRTLEGFQVLVEREWLHFGHKFGERGGHDPNCSDTNQISPIFLQFLDCVYQLTCQYPARFQFNEAYLVKLLQHSYACLFGNFLHNCQRERDVCQQKTASVWALLHPENTQFVNALYKPSDQVLKAKFSEPEIVLWKSVYMGSHVNQTDSDREPRPAAMGARSSVATSDEALRSKLLDDLSKVSICDGHQNIIQCDAVAAASAAAADPSTNYVCNKSSSTEPLHSHGQTPQANGRPSPLGALEETSPDSSGRMSLGFSAGTEYGSDKVVSTSHSGVSTVEASLMEGITKSSTTATMEDALEEAPQDSAEQQIWPNHPENVPVNGSGVTENSDEGQNVVTSSECCQKAEVSGKCDDQSLCGYQKECGGVQTLCCDKLLASTNNVIDKTGFVEAGLANPDNFLAGLVNTDHFQAGLVNSDNSGAGLVSTDNSVAGFMNIDNSWAGLGNPDNFEAGLANPDNFVAGLVNPGNFDAGLVNSDNFHAGLGNHDNSEVGLANPDDSEAGLVNPDNFQAGLANPDNSVAGLMNTEAGLANSDNFDPGNVDNNIANPGSFGTGEINSNMDSSDGNDAGNINIHIDSIDSGNIDSSINKWCSVSADVTNSNIDSVISFKAATANSDNGSREVGKNISDVSGSSEAGNTDNHVDDADSFEVEKTEHANVKDGSTDSCEVEIINSNTDSTDSCEAENIKSNTENLDRFEVSNINSNVDNPDSFEAEISNIDNPDSFEAGNISIDNPDSFEAGNISIDNPDSFEAGNINIDNPDSFEAGNINIDNPDSFEAGNINIDNPDSFEVDNANSNFDNPDSFETGNTNADNLDSFEAGNTNIDNPYNFEAEISNIDNPISFEVGNTNADSLDTFETGNINIDNPDSFEADDTNIDHSDSFETGNINIDNPDSFEADNTNIDHTDSFETGNINIDNPDSFEADNTNIDHTDSFETGNINIDNPDSFEADNTNIDHADSFETGNINIDNPDSFEAGNTNLDSPESFEAGNTRCDIASLESSEAGKVSVASCDNKLFQAEALSSNFLDISFQAGQVNCCHIVSNSSGSSVISVLDFSKQTSVNGSATSGYNSEKASLSSNTSSLSGDTDEALNDVFENGTGGNCELKYSEMRHNCCENSQMSQNYCENSERRHTSCENNQVSHTNCENSQCFVKSSDIKNYVSAVEDIIPRKDTRRSTVNSTNFFDYSSGNNSEIHGGMVRTSNYNSDPFLFNSLDPVEMNNLSGSRTCASCRVSVDTLTDKAQVRTFMSSSTSCCTKPLEIATRHGRPRSAIPHASSSPVLTSRALSKKRDCRPLEMNEACYKSKMLSRLSGTAVGASQGVSVFPACLCRRTDADHQYHPSASEVVSRRLLRATVSTSTTDISDSSIGQPSPSLLTMTTAKRQPRLKKHIDVDGLALFCDEWQDLVAELLSEKDCTIQELQRHLRHATKHVHMLKSYSSRQLQGSLCDHCMADSHRGEWSSLGPMIDSACDASWETVDVSVSRMLPCASDLAVTHCAGCGAEFGVSRWKHHCRNCGKFFRTECSQVLAQEVELNQSEGVCRRCHSQLPQLSPGASSDGRIPTLEADSYIES